MRSAGPALKTVSHWWWALRPSVVDVQADAGVIDEALEEFTSCQSSAPIMPAVKGTSNSSPGRLERSTTTRDRASSRGHVGVAITGQALLVADRLGEGLADGDAHILDGVVAVDVGSPTASIQVEAAVAGNLVEHVVEETDAGVELTLAAAVEVDPDADLRLEGVAGYFGVPHCVVFQENSRNWGTKGMIASSVFTVPLRHARRRADLP